MILDIRNAAGLVMSLLKLELQTKLTNQGYGTAQSSALIRSIEPEIKVVSETVVGLMYMNDYYQFVEEGVEASKVPYTPGSRNGGVSQYIQGLIKFFMRKLRLGFKEAKRASFATANKHSKEGIPLRTSLAYSRDGTRLHFIRDTLEKNIEKAEEILQRTVGNQIEIQLTTMLRSFSEQGLKIIA